MNWDLLENKTKQKTNKKTENKPNQTQQLNHLPVTSVLQGKWEMLGQVLPRGSGWAAQPQINLTAHSSSFLHLARQPVLDPVSPSHWLWPHIRTVHVANLAKKCSLFGWVSFLVVASWISLLQGQISTRSPEQDLPLVTASYFINLHCITSLHTCSTGRNGSTALFSM